MNISGISNQTNAVLNAFLENDALFTAGILAGPAVVSGVISAGTRVVAGGAALGLKGASALADLAGKKEWSETLNNGANRSINFAKRSIVPEVKAALGLTVVAGTIFLASQTMAKPETQPQLFGNETCPSNLNLTAYYASLNPSSSPNVTANVTAIAENVIANVTANINVNATTFNSQTLNAYKMMANTVENLNYGWATLKNLPSSIMEAFAEQVATSQL